MTICSTCDYEKPSTRCGQHPLMYGVVKELHQATLDGLKWGNMMYALEQQALAKMSLAEKAALEAKKVAADLADKKKVLAYTVDLRKKLYTSADGLAKRKFNRMCKKERYDGGCLLHNEKHGSCSFVHKDERSRYEAMFAGFGMKMVDDASYFVELAKMDKAVGDVKYRLKSMCDAMEMTLKGQARCVFITGVDVAGNLTFSKANPAYDEGKSSSKSSGSGGTAKKPQMQQRGNVWEKKVDNGAW